MKALVTGGAGFIGANLANALVSSGNEVSILDDLSSGHQANLVDLPCVRFIEGDIANAVAVQEAIKGTDVVFHLAASVGNKRSILDPLKDSRVNVLGTVNVLQQAVRAGVKKIVFSSSAGVFGELRQLPIAEEHPTEPDTPYGASKLGAEKQCLAFAKTYDIEAVCLRYFNVYGPLQRSDEYGNVIPIFVFKMLAGETVAVFGDGEQSRDFVNVQDVVQANLKAASVTGFSGVYNVASGKRLTINTLVKMLRDLTGTSSPVVHEPERVGDVRHSVADIRAARAAFEYQPIIAIEDGLADYVEWAKHL